MCGSLEMHKRRPMEDGNCPIEPVGEEREGSAASWEGTPALSLASPARSNPRSHSRLVRRYCFKITVVIMLTIATACISTWPIFTSQCTFIFSVFLFSSPPSSKAAGVLLFLLHKDEEGESKGVPSVICSKSPGSLGARLRPWN